MKSILCLVWLLACEVLSAQLQPWVYSLGRERGLDGANLYQLVFDAAGTAYIGTESGLVKFNGRRFYRIPFLSTRRLGVSRLHFDQQQRLWCQNFGGQVFFLRNDTLIPYRQHEKIVGKDYMTSWIYIQDNHLWFAVRDTLWAINLRTDQISKSWDLKALGCEKCRNFMLRGNRAVVLYNEHYLFHFQIDAGVQKIKKGAPSKLALSKLSPNGYIANYTPLKVEIDIFSPHHQRLTSVDLRGYSIGTINDIQFQDDKLRVMTNNGVLEVDTILWQVQNHFLPGKNISYVAVDPTGGQWFTGFDGDLYHYHPQGVSQLLPGLHLEPLNIFSDGRHKFVLDKTNNMVYELDQNWAHPKPLFTTTRDDILYYDSVAQMVATGNKIWYRRTGIFCSTDGPKDLVRLPGNRFLKATSNQVTVTDSARLCKTDVYITNLAARRGNAVAYAGNRLYGADALGLFVYNAQNYRLIKEIQVEGQSVTAFSLKNNGGYVWAGTVQHGLLMIYDTTVIRCWEDSVFSGVPIVEMRHSGNHLWIRQPSRISHFDTRTFTFRHFDLSYLPRVNAMAAEGDSIILATPQGLLCITLRTTQNSRTFRNMTIRLRDASGNYLPEAIPPATKGLTAQIDYNVWNLRSVDKLMYRLRDYWGVTDWTALSDNQDRIDLQGLSAGDYTLEVAVFEDEKQVLTKEVYFRKLPSWWQTWWARLILFLLLSVIIVYAIKWFYNVREKRLQTERTLLKFQLTALRSQLNPHFMYNVLNTLQSMIVYDRKEDAHTIISHFSDLMRSVLDKSSIQTWTIEQEIELLKKYITIEQFRFSNDLTYTIDCPVDLYRHEVPAMLTQPFVENAIKHGLRHVQHEKKLLISYKLVTHPVGRQLIITIDDNGIGRAASHQINTRLKSNSAHFSTQANLNRAALIGEATGMRVAIDILDKFDNNRPAGTTVIIKISQ